MLCLIHPYTNQRGLCYVKDSNRDVAAWREKKYGKTVFFFVLERIEGREDVHVLRFRGYLLVEIRKVPHDVDKVSRYRFRGYVEEV